MNRGWTRVCRLDEVREGQGASFELHGARVALARDGDVIFALGDRCPHAGGSLGFGWVDDGALVCPLHHWRFRLRDGRCTDVSGYGVSRWDCEVRDDEVWIRF